MRINFFETVFMGGNMFDTGEVMPVEWTSINHLDKDILGEVFSHLDTQSLCRIQCVNKFFNVVGQDNLDAVGEHLRKYPAVGNKLIGAQEFFDWIKNHVKIMPDESANPKAIKVHYTKGRWLVKKIRTTKMAESRAGRQQLLPQREARASLVEILVDEARKKYEAKIKPAG
jgi:hypothetical protein